MDPVTRFQLQTLKVCKAALAKAQKDVVLFKGLRSSARKLGSDDFGVKVLLERAYEQVRTLKDVIADITRRK
ncbi:MAG TPA: hypothetical protein VNV41_16295 [Candidatus Acidoferrales bacterium]|jgi:hypothetical protein|nr:hypothetical protein [Candidatus Acidoferrales bacterium]